MIFASYSDDDDKGKANIATKVRTTGLSKAAFSLAAHSKNPSINLLDYMQANSSISLTSFKIPIISINLVNGLTGSGYTGTSPYFYSCTPSATDECMVDILNSGLDSLIATSGGEVIAETDVTNDGVAVEFCTTGQTQYSIKMTGSVELGSTTYYTNATSGLSATAPAEEVSVPISCSGMTTPLLTPTVLGPDKSVELVLYADPNGMAIATTNKTLVNSNCVGEESLALCTGRANVFATVDTVQPTIERYQLDVSTQTTSSVNYADMLLTVLYNSSAQPIGASIQEYYANDTRERNMHTNQLVFNSVTNTNNVLSFSYYDTTNVITGVGKATTTADLQMSQLVDNTVTFTASLLSE